MTDRTVADFTRHAHAAGRRDGGRERVRSVQGLRRSRSATCLRRSAARRTTYPRQCEGSSSRSGKRR
jgi:hypothetical protein